MTSYNKILNSGGYRFTVKFFIEKQPEFDFIRLGDARVVISDGFADDYSLVSISSGCEEDFYIAVYKYYQLRKDKSLHLSYEVCK